MSSLPTSTGSVEPLNSPWPRQLDGYKQTKHRSKEMERQRKRGYGVYPLAPVPQVHTSPIAVTAAVCASPQSTCVIADEKSVSTNSGFHFCCLSPPPSYKWNVGTRWVDSVFRDKKSE